ncbi:MAG: NAD(P)/FAD-dependent oxidoreductase [Gaiellales bacterium]
MSGRPYDVVVIGGGLMGCATAHALLQRDAGRVCLIERRAPAAGDSGLSFGMVRRHYSNEVLIRLAVSGSRTIANWRDEVGVGSSGWVRTGYLMTVRPEEAEVCARQVELGRSLGVDNEFIAPGAIPDVEPLISLDGVGGAAHEPGGGVADPNAMILSWFSAAVAEGLEPMLGVRVTGIRTDGEGVIGVDTDAGPVEAGAVVVATGCWSQPLLRTIGIDLPLELRRIQTGVLRLPPGTPGPSVTVSDGVSGVVVRPGMGREFWSVVYHDEQRPEHRDDCEPAISPGYDEAVRAGLAARWPSLAGAEWARGWAGAYDCTPDWHPLLGPAPGLEGLHLAVGWSGHGFKLAPAVGRVVADSVLGLEPEVDVSQLAPGRFEAGRAMPLAYGAGARA